MIKEFVKNIYGDKVRKAMHRADGWMNEITGLGTDRDKASFSAFVSNEKLTEEQLDNLYHDNDAAALICDKVAEDAMRGGFLVKIRDKEADKKSKAENATDVIKFLEEMDATEKLVDAWVWSNVQGMSAIVLGVEDGRRDDQPLDWDNIESFTHMNLVEKPYIEPKEWYTDPKEKGFGKPKTYTIKPTPGQSAKYSGVALPEIHESRMVIFGGVRTSLRKRKENQGFDYSSLQKTHQVLKQFGVSWDNLAHILQDCFQGVFKMEGLMESLSAEEHGLIDARMALLDRSRSAIRALILDAEGEEFDRQAFNFIGLDRIYDLFMMRLSMAARIPVTILMGRSPAGENATGDADFQAWYDHVDAERMRKVHKSIKKISRLALAAKNGPTKGVEPKFWSVEYPPLWQPSAIEKAEIFAKYADAFKKYVESGILIPEEVAFSVFTVTGFDPEINIDEAARKLQLELEREMMKIEAAAAAKPAEQLPAKPVEPATPAKGTDDGDTE